MTAILPRHPRFPADRTALRPRCAEVARAQHALLAERHRERAAGERRAALVFLWPPGAAPAGAAAATDARRWLTLHLSMPVTLTVTPTAKPASVTATAQGGSTAAAAPAAPADTIAVSSLPFRAGWSVEPIRRPVVRERPFRAALRSVAIPGTADVRHSFTPTSRMTAATHRDTVAAPGGIGRDARPDVATLVYARSAGRPAAADVRGTPAATAHRSATARTLRERIDAATRWASALIVRALVTNGRDRPARTAERGIASRGAPPALTLQRRADRSAAETGADGARAAPAGPRTANGQPRASSVLRLITLTAAAATVSASAREAVFVALRPPAGTAPAAIPRPGPRMVYRQSPPPIASNGDRQARRIERQVHERIIRDLPRSAATASTPAAALTPQLVRSLTDRVCREVERRMDLDRYRRGR